MGLSVLICDVQVSRVDFPQRITISNQTTLPVVVEIIPANCHPISSPHQITLPIVVVRAMVNVAFKLVMVDPHPGAILDRNTVVVEDKSDAEVSHNDVGSIGNSDARVQDIGSCAGANQGLVAADEQARGQFEGAFDADG